MKIMTVATIDKTEHGHLLKQGVLAYEVRMTSRKPDAKWRSNHSIMCIASNVSEAINMASVLYPDDPIIDQVVLRNRGMDLLISGDAINKDSAVEYA